MDSVLACLATWMPRQRWYASKGRTPALRFVGSWDLPGVEPGARAQTLLVYDEGSLPPILYQVPVVARPTSTVDPHRDGVIGSPDPGLTLLDGPYDPAYTTALYRLVTRGGEATGPRASARGVVGRDGVWDDPGEVSASVLRGEQSNTSIVYRAADERRSVICKLYRQLSAGRNPDIELQSALSTSGSPFVPRTAGHLDGTWQDPAEHATTSGSLAFAQEYVTGAEDAWRVALRAAASGEDFTDHARGIGEATAGVHASLARLFPTEPATQADRAETATTWRRRLLTAIAEVPQVGAHRAAIEAVYARALHIPGPARQRVHGDLHLGQTILAPVRGWMLLDFEGEPLRPMSERRRPDLALRDVAGMLRSFAYVGGAMRLDHPNGPPAEATAWTDAASAAFLDAYREASGVRMDDVAPLLRALELDKAVYEALYESRNRPTWTDIPLAAIASLTG